MDEEKELECRFYFTQLNVVRWMKTSRYIVDQIDKHTWKTINVSCWPGNKCVKKKWRHPRQELRN